MKRMVIGVIRNIIEIEDVNYLKMSHPLVAEMGHVMVSSEWTVEESRHVSENRVSLVN